MPFGFMNTPAMFQRMAGTLFSDVSFVKFYIEDVFICPRKVGKHIDYLLKMGEIIKVMRL